MRAAILLGLALATPAAATPDTPAARADAKLARITAGRVAGKPVRCIRPERVVPPDIIEGRALAYRAGRILYVGTMLNDCPWIRQGRTFVTRTNGGLFCRGDPVRVVDTGILLGQCAFGDFTPYTRLK